MKNRCVVMDIGAYSSKVGLAGEDNPSLVFFTRVGKPKYRNLDTTYMNQEQELYVGDEIQSIGLYKIFHPIQEGKIVHWNYFEKLINYIFYRLRVDPTLINVLFAVHPLFPKGDIKKMFDLFLGKIQCRAFYPILDSMLVLYSGGFDTGLVIEIGESSTRIIPIYKGYKINHAIKILNMGGKVLTEYMAEQIKNNTPYNVDSSIKREIVRAIKEKACFVSLDYDEDLKRAEQYEKEFYLPDGSKMNLSETRFAVPEILFKSMPNLENEPLHEAVFDVLEKVDVDLRPELLNNIFLSGGSSMFPNTKARLYKELEFELARRDKQDQVIRIRAPRKRDFSVWIGGSIFGVIPESDNKWITRAHYFREGIPKDIL